MNEPLLPPPTDPTITQEEYQGWLQRLKQIQTTKHQQPDQPRQITPYDTTPTTQTDQTHIPNKIPFNVYNTDRRWYRANNK